MSSHRLALLLEPMHRSQIQSCLQVPSLNGNIFMCFPPIHVTVVVGNSQAVFRQVNEKGCLRMFPFTCRMCADTFQHETTTEWHIRSVTSNSTVLCSFGSILSVGFLAFSLSFLLQNILVRRECHSNPQINIQPMPFQTSKFALDFQRDEKN